MNLNRFLSDGRTGFICRSIIILIVIGLVARYVLGVFFTCPDDVHSWALVISNIESGENLYGLDGYFYAPPWGYILAVIGAVAEFFGLGSFGALDPGALPLEEYAVWLSNAYIPSIGFVLSVKTAFAICDLVVGYLVYTIVRDYTKDHRKAVIGFALWFLCPFVITSGSVQGMFEDFAVLAMLLSVVLLMRDHCFLAGAMLSLAGLTKLFPAILIFILVAYLLMRHRDDGKAVSHLVMAALGAAMMAAVILVPQAMNGDLAECFSFITSRATNMGAGTTGDGFGSIVSYITVLSYILILLASMVLAIHMYRSRTSDPDRMLLLFATANMAMAFLYPSMAQYITLLAPFLAITVAAIDRRYMTAFKVLMVGVPIFAFSRSVMNLLTFAAAGYMDMGTLVDAIIWTQEPLFLGITPSNILSGIGGGLEYLGVALVVLTFIVTYVRGRDSRASPWRPDGDPAES